MLKKIFGWRINQAAYNDTNQKQNASNATDRLHDYYITDFSGLSGITNKKLILDLSFIFTIGMLLAYVTELVGHGFSRRWGPQGVWLSACMCLFFLVMNILLVYRYIRRWQAKKEWRRKGFIDYFTLGSLDYRTSMDTNSGFDKNDLDTNFFDKLFNFFSCIGCGFSKSNQSRRSKSSKALGPHFLSTSPDDLNESMETLPTTFLPSGRKKHNSMHHTYTGSFMKQFDDVEAPRYSWLGSWLGSWLSPWKSKPFLKSTSKRNSTENTPLITDGRDGKSSSHKKSHDSQSKKRPHRSSSEFQKSKRSSKRSGKHSSHNSRTTNKSRRGRTMFSVEDLIGKEATNTLKQLDQEEIRIGNKSKPHHFNLSQNETNLYTKNRLGIIPRIWSKKELNPKANHTIQYDDSDNSITDLSNQSFAISSPNRSSSVSHSIGSVYTVHSPTHTILHYGRYANQSKTVSSRLAYETGNDDLPSSFQSHSSNLSENVSETTGMIGYDTPPDEIEMETSHPFSGEDTPSPNRRRIFATPHSKSLFSPLSPYTPASPHSASQKKQVLTKFSGKPARRKLYTEHTTSPSNPPHHLAETIECEDSRHNIQFYSFGLPFILIICILLSFFENIIGVTTTNNFQNAAHDISKSAFITLNSILPSDKRCTFPLSWPPQSAFEIVSYVLMCISSISFILARVGQILYMHRKGSVHGFSKLMVMTFQCSNILVATSITSNVIVTRDYISQLPYIIGTGFVLILDLYIFILALLLNCRKDSNTFGIYFDEDEDDI